MESTVNISVPMLSTGEFEFRFYVDGVLDSSATEIRDVSLSSARELKYVVKGQPGETKRLTVKVKNTNTGAEGIFYEYRIDFTEEEDPEQTVEFRNSDIFELLLGGGEDPTSSDNNSSDHIDTSPADDTNE